MTTINTKHCGKLTFYIEVINVILLYYYLSSYISNINWFQLFILFNDENKFYQSLIFREHGQQMKLLYLLCTISDATVMNHLDILKP